MTLRSFLRWFLGRSAVPRPLDKAAELAAVRTLAATVNTYINELHHPTELEGKPEFLEGVALLAQPCFAARELLELSTDPSDALWQMGVKAAARREPDPDLTDALLACYSAGGLWHQHFALEALEAHAPLERSLAGELLFRRRRDGGELLQHMLKKCSPLLSRRLEDGEEPAFGGLLDQLDKQGSAWLLDTLQVAVAAAVPGAASLLAEFQAWQEAFVDQDQLRTMGRLWDPADDAEPLVLDHPLLTRLAADVVRAVVHEPRRPVLLVGEHGVGKTAVMLHAGRELRRRGWLVFQAAGSDLLAGQMFIGQLEQRVKDLVTQLAGGRRVVWYVPDFHSLGWAGTHGNSRTAILDLILPHLEAGALALVGELPHRAYEQLVLERPRLANACKVCRVQPLDEAATLALGRAWSAARGPRPGEPLVTDAVLQEAWLLARQYLQDRETPGCLLDLLEAAADADRGAAGTDAVLGTDDLLSTLARLTGLPREILDERQRLDTDQLRAFFAGRILGQPEAVACLVERITLIKAGLTDPTRPQGVFLFAGPTGTGKTEIAKALAAYLFGSEQRLLRYDMSEFQSPDGLHRLAGDAEHPERESLTMRIRKQPFAVVLLDEFEKAHPKVWDLFLQVFDDGRLTDPSGHTADFRHAIIILTSNLGGRAATAAGLGFAQDGAGFRAGDVDKAVVQAFRPEFLNRLDRVVVFRPFSREIMREILDKELREVQRRRGLRNRSWAVVWEDSALEFLLDRGFSPTLGARPLRRAIERYLLTPLAQTIVQGRFPAGDQFLYIHAQDERLSAEFIDPQADDDRSEPPATVADDPGTGTPADTSRCLAAIALSPTGSPDDFADLQDHLARLRDHLASPAWQEAKSLALSMTALPDFWTSPERFAVLGEVEYRERVASGLQAAGELVFRLAGTRRGPEVRYPRKLVGQAAERLHLLDLACGALAARTPWEALVQIEAKHDPQADPAGADTLVDRLGAMYEAWGRQRRMKVQVLDNTPRTVGRGRALLLGVSGYAACTILAPESGLHVWEEPEPGRPRGTVQHRALVRVAPLPAESPADDSRSWLDAGRQAMAAPSPSAPSVVRIYRERPDPLVKDRTVGWRTGRLDRVLGGDFDLLGASAGDRAVQESG
ncbi:MAG: AAA family ATPase [Candidatus Krumholzibacteriia bacterium]